MSNHEGYYFDMKTNKEINIESDKLKEVINLYVIIY